MEYFGQETDRTATGSEVGGGVLPGRGLRVAPSFHNSIWRSRSRGAADGVQVLAGSMKLLSSQGESGNNIGPPPIHQQAHCLE